MARPSIPRTPTDLEGTSHRPWPLPGRPWAMRMTWHDLAFLHWPVPASALRAHVPPGLDLDTHDGDAWLGVVPFWMSGVTPRGIPALPGLSRFPEINLRTYVTVNGKPGVWFFSLDAAHRLAVTVARRTFHLPYFHARMRVETDDEAAVRYTSERIHRSAAAASFAGRYRPTGDAAPPAPGSLEEFLTERYCLYSADRRGRLFRGDVHHAPWPLQPAEVELTTNAMAEQIGLSLPRTGALAHFVGRLDVRAWRIVAVDG